MTFKNKNKKNYKRAGKKIQEAIEILKQIKKDNPRDYDCECYIKELETFMSSDYDCGYYIINFSSKIT